MSRPDPHPGPDAHFAGAAAAHAPAARVLARARRIVIYRLGSLGDTVVALPCLHRIAQLAPQAERLLLTNVPVSSKAAPMALILGDSGLVHRTLAYPLGTRSAAALRVLLGALRAEAADALVYLTPARGLAVAWRDLAYFRLAGLRHVIGAPLTPARQHNTVGPDGQVERECERLARCLAALGPIDVHDPAAWDLRLSAAEHAAAARALAPAGAAPRIAINMGGKVARNDWGEDRWWALMQRLATAVGDHALVIVGGAEDAGRAVRLGARWPGPVVSLCGRLAPRESAAAMAGSRLFIGHDSGPLHLAAAVQVPCIGLFGDNNRPAKWHPVGPQHRLLHDMRGVQAIAVQAVAEAVLAQLHAARPAGLPASPSSSFAASVPVAPVAPAAPRAVTALPTIGRAA